MPSWVTAQAITLFINYIEKRELSIPTWTDAIDLFNITEFFQIYHLREAIFEYMLKEADKNIQVAFQVLNEFAIRSSVSTNAIELWNMIIIGLIKICGKHIIFTDEQISPYLSNIDKQISNVILQISCQYLMQLQTNDRRNRKIIEVVEALASLKETNVCELLQKEIQQCQKESIELINDPNRTYKWQIRDTYTNIEQEIIFMHDKWKLKYTYKKSKGQIVLVKEKDAFQPTQTFHAEKPTFGIRSCSISAKKPTISYESPHPNMGFSQKIKKVDSRVNKSSKKCVCAKEKPNAIVNKLQKNVNIDTIFSSVHSILLGKGECVTICSNVQRMCQNCLPIMCFMNCAKNVKEEKDTKITITYHNIKSDRPILLKEYLFNNSNSKLIALDLFFMVNVFPTIIMNYLVLKIPTMQFYNSNINLLTFQQLYFLISQSTDVEFIRLQELVTCWLSEKINDGDAIEGKRLNELLHSKEQQLMEKREMHTEESDNLNSSHSKYRSTPFKSKFEADTEKNLDTSETDKLKAKLKEKDSEIVHLRKEIEDFKFKNKIAYSIIESPQQYHQFKHIAQKRMLNSSNISEEADSKKPTNNTTVNYISVNQPVLDSESSVECVSATPKFRISLKDIMHKHIYNQQ